MSIDRHIIQQVRQTDLHSFLLSKGEPLRRVGKRWQHKEHDSLMISGNMFYWNSRNEKGNSLDFVMLYYGWSFEQAIQELTNHQPIKEECGTGKEEGKKQGELHIVEAHNNKRVIAYLCNTRNIPYKLIKQLLDSNYLRQDDHNNAVFKVYDEKGKLVGAELVGTLSTVRFKGIGEGTKVGYGFNVTIGNPEKTLFFESPIDLLSFWSLNEKQLTAHRLISLAGLREDIFRNTLEMWKIDPSTAYLCVDNDEAGKAFIRTIQAQYPSVKVYLPKAVKDWNDQLSGKQKCSEINL